MSYIVSAKGYDLEGLSETAAEVLRNVMLILTTREGEAPMYRDFGLKQRFLDKPLPAATVLFRAELKEKLEKYEPRAEIVKVGFDVDSNDTARLIPWVEVKVIE